MARGYNLPIGRPVDIADGLRVLGELLEEHPGVDLSEIGDAVEADGVIFFGGEGAVGSILGECQGRDAVGLPHPGVAYFRFHDILFISLKTQSKQGWRRGNN